MNTDLGQDLTWQVYLLRCADQSLYAGVTTDLDRRLQQHNGQLAGGARYTQARRSTRLGITSTASQLSIVLLKPPVQIRGDTRVERLISTPQQVNLPC